MSLTGAKFTNGWCRSIHGSISLRQSLESLAFWSKRRGLIPSSKFSLHRCIYFLSVLILVAAGCCYNSDLFLIFKKDNTNKSLNTCNCLHYFIYFFFHFSPSVCSLAHLPVHCWEYPNWVSISELFLRTTQMSQTIKCFKRINHQIDSGAQGFRVLRGRLFISVHRGKIHICLPTWNPREKDTHTGVLSVLV